jgi:membrane protein implicated in regulation of membrane protease activity
MSVWLNKEKWISVGKGLLIAAGGAAVVYLSEVVTQVDFGPFTAMFVVVASTVINYLRKVLQEYQEKQEDTNLYDGKNRPSY